MSRDDDLYAPSLDASHDATDIRPPWRPESLLFPTFFGGAFTAAILYGANARFLGRGRTLPWIVGTFAVIGVAVVVVAFEFRARVDAGTIDDSEDTLRLFRFGSRLVPLLVALGVGATQRARYRLYPDEDRPLFLPGLGAVLAGWGLNYAVAMVVILFRQG